MSSWRGPLIAGKRARSASITLRGVVHRQRGLGHVGQRLGVAHLQGRDLLGALDQVDRAAIGGVVLAHRALDLGMPGVADQDAFAPLAAVARHFHVHLGHQRAGGVEDLERAPRGFLLHRLRDAVRAEDHDHAVRHLVELVDEHRAARAQVVDHELVVHHFVAHVDRRAEHLQRAVDDLDRAIDAGAEAARVSQPDLHVDPPGRGTARRPSS